MLLMAKTVQANSSASQEEAMSTSCSQDEVGGNYGYDPSYASRSRKRKSRKSTTESSDSDSGTDGEVFEQTAQEQPDFEEASQEIEQSAQEQPTFEAACQEGDIFSDEAVFTALKRDATKTFRCPRNMAGYTQKCSTKQAYL
jgi:hypothetical protein